MSTAVRNASPAFCVCIPARDEKERLPVLLKALAEQDVEGTIPVAICLNNCTDRSAAVLGEASIRYRKRLSIQVEVRTFPLELAHAGSARAAAMALGAQELRGGGILISTDADTRPPPGWIAANLAAIKTGREIVGGRLVLDDDETIPPAIAKGRALWDSYWTSVRRIEDAIDPCPWDPAPRHGDHTGASLALTVALYRACGGVPAIATGEDRALVDAAIAAGGRLVHPMTVWTRVSARRTGRAAGGMAADMDGMEAAALQGQPLMAPALDHWRERANWRRALRAAQGDGAVREAERMLAPMPHDAELARMDFAL